MTDVLVLKRIPGLRPGQIVPLTPRLEQHIDAGNVKILPNENPSFGTEPAVAPAQPGITSVGPRDVLADDEAAIDAAFAEDEDTDPED